MSLLDDNDGIKTTKANECEHVRSCYLVIPPINSTTQLIEGSFKISL